MKIKKIRKKLTFNKETIAHLSNIEIKDVFGGGGEIPPASRHDSGCIVCETFTCAPSICSGLYCC
jgi:natural product precursor